MVDNNPVRLLLADDHQMFRAGIGNLLRKEAGFEIIAEAGDGTEALRLTRQLMPDVILLDVRMPLLDGIGCTRQLLSWNPKANILALSSFEDEEHVLGMVKAGAKGYILKEAPFEELVLAIKAVAKGSSYFSKEISLKIFTCLVPSEVVSREKDNKGYSLTERELEVLRFIAGELTNREIAERLYISPRTVETHRRNLIQKLKVKNTVGLVKFYLHHLEVSES